MDDLHGDGAHGGDVAGVEILRVSLPVRSEARGIVGCDSREVAFVRVVDGPHAGFGECAPLAGLHRESLDECIEAIERWSDGEIEFDAMPPCAAFAASCAVETAEVFGTRVSGPVAVAGFFAGSAEDFDGAAIQALGGARSGGPRSRSCFPSHVCPPRWRACCRRCWPARRTHAAGPLHSCLSPFSLSLHALTVSLFFIF